MSRFIVEGSRIMDRQELIWMSPELAAERVSRLTEIAMWTPHGPARFTAFEAVNDLLTAIDQATVHNPPANDGAAVLTLVAA